MPRENTRVEVEIRIEEIEKLFWNQDLIDHIRKYGDKCYATEFTCDQLRQQQTAYEHGILTVLSSKSDFHRIFKIYDVITNMFVGTITLNKPEDGYWEIDVAVFDKFSNRGIATKAILLTVELLKRKGESKVEALVRKENPSAEKVTLMLQKNGFYKAGETVLNYFFINDLIQDI